MKEKKKLKFLCFFVSFSQDLSNKIKNLAFLYYILFNKKKENQKCEKCSKLKIFKGYVFFRDEIFFAVSWRKNVI